ncbi:Signal recognition particle 14 kDa protein [Anabarilius grahami]|uniref:Signal recognition particle 14 kDa protein n=1 Tax=Anabarilius grahami TaxID=495550 RepID=A0A3N0XML1_ANAGA|nr:Signal recognition particle 14 kDa protein [Anabarilius grahami]
MNNSIVSLQFLTELTRLFQKCRTSGSVVITLKKYDGRTKPVPRKGHPETFEPADNKCLVRASEGKKKISTVPLQRHLQCETPDIVRRFCSEIIRKNLPTFDNRCFKTIRLQVDRCN